MSVPKYAKVSRKNAKEYGKGQRKVRQTEMKPFTQKKTQAEIERDQKKGIWGEHKGGIKRGGRDVKPKASMSKKTYKKLMKAGKRNKPKV